ncbi:SDR family NAD(P)-dependent oxidoreductase [Rhodococcus sp. NPDC059968]|uniref:SDR family NAD(P)-dependent oxidoreductase n=1 Tax=Rhodococcus sp. NPDC059968 TaxID=3347017 RepID=UPI00366CA781
MESLHGRVAVITGAAGGIGEALGSVLAASGMKLALADIDAEGLIAARDRLADAGAEVIAVPTDVTSEESVIRLKDCTLEHFGSVHVLCNNAGVTVTGAAWTIPVSAWEKVLSVNLIGVINGIRTFVPVMKSNCEGHVVNTASMAGLTSAAGLAPYSVSKHGVVALSEAIYKELVLEDSGIGVSVVCPGAVTTAMPSSVAAATLGDQGPIDRAITRAVDESLKGAIAPIRVAEMIRNAILADQFWVLTHPSRANSVVRRTRGIVAGINPEPAAF